MPNVYNSNAGSVPEKDSVKEVKVASILVAVADFL
jgi:hypothetical protein